MNDGAPIPINRAKGLSGPDGGAAGIPAGQYGVLCMYALVDHPNHGPYWTVTGYFVVDIDDEHKALRDFPTLEQAQSHAAELNGIAPSQEEPRNTGKGGRYKRPGS